MVNLNKLEIFFLNTNNQIEEEICQTLGFKKEKFPCRYLGLPLDKGNKVNKLWDSIVTRMQHKMDSWKGKWASNAGRATMLKSILFSIPIYQMSCLPLTQGSKAKVENKIRTFYWQGVSDERKLA